MTNCPNCCAPVDPSADRCAYCWTPYPKPMKTTQAVAEPVTVQIDGAQLSRTLAEIEAAIITPNEARRRMGLREV